MKYRSVSSDKKEVIKGLGGGAYLALGGKNFALFNLIWILPLFLIEITSVGPRLYFRKNMGFWAANPFTLGFHLLIVYLFFYEETKGRAFTFARYISIDTRWDSAKILAWYMAGIFILIFYHWFESLILKGKARHSLHRGYGFLSIFFGRSDEVNKYLWFIDPLFILIAAWLFDNIKGGQPLSLILFIGGCAVLLEELIIFFRTWMAETEITDLTVEAEYQAKTQDTNPTEAQDSPTTFRARSAKDK